MHVRVDASRRLVAVRGFGTVSDSDVFHYQATTWRRPDVQGFDELVDMTDVEDVYVAAAGRTEDLARVAAGMDRFEKESRLAIVAPGDSAFRLAQGYGAMRERIGGGHKRVGVFRSRPEAEAWLGLEPGAIAALLDPEP